MGIKAEANGHNTVLVFQDITYPEEKDSNCSHLILGNHTGAIVAQKGMAKTSRKNEIAGVMP